MTDSTLGDETPARNEPVLARTGRELARLREQIAAARLELAQRQHDVAEAERHLGSLQAAQLLEANEQLVMATLRAHTAADTAQRALSKASRLAELDSLTELPNRALMLDRLAHAIAVARRNQAHVAVLFLDVDDFKGINDTLGHAVGDQVLKHVAYCLASSVREADTVSRHGGDEFLILLADVSLPSDALLVASKVTAAVGVPCLFGGQAFRLSVSIGISLYPDDGEDSDTLIASADAAMYRAKRNRLGTSLGRAENAPPA